MRQYRRRSYRMLAEKVPDGTHLYNFVYDTTEFSTAEKCIRIVGTVEEEWPITMEELITEFCFLDGTLITEENLPDDIFKVRAIIHPDEKTVFAEMVEGEVQVKTKNGDVLTANRKGVPHAAGDFIVYANSNGVPDETDKWVVSGMVFNKLYKAI